MIRLYTFVFYLIYSAFRKLNRKDIPEINAILFMSLWNFMYLMIPFAVARYVTGMDLRIPKVLVAGVILSICLVKYFLLIYNRKYWRIYRKCQKQVEFRYKYGIYVLIGYLVLPILVFAIFTFTIWRR
jgi:hypothetical protein